jgi:hypothetical protein
MNKLSVERFPCPASGRQFRCPLPVRFFFHHSAPEHFFLKGLGHEDRNKTFGQKWIYLGPDKKLYWFLNF